MKFVEFNAVDDVDPEQWRTLWEQSRDATVFQTQAWMRAWTAVFAPSRDDVKLITAWEDARLIGIAPIARSALHARGGEGEWAFLGDDYSDYQVFLAWDDSPDIIEEMLDAVLRSVPYTAKLALRDVPQYSTLGLLLAKRSSQTSSMLTAKHNSMPSAMRSCVRPCTAKSLWNGETKRTIIVSRPRIIGCFPWEEAGMKLILILFSLTAGTAALIETVELMNAATAVIANAGSMR
jgi:hypothetical protein